MIKSISNKESGFTLLMAVIITSVLLIISVGIISIAVKQAQLATASRDSQRAFYAADSALECALYWDLKNPGTSAFGVGASPGTPITCNNQTVGGNAVGGVTSVTLTYTDTACILAELDVTKKTAVSPKTIIRAFGYSSCSNTDPRRVQRTLSVQY